MNRIPQTKRSLLPIHVLLLFFLPSLLLTYTTVQVQARHLVDLQSSAAIQSALNDGVDNLDNELSVVDGTTSVVGNVKDNDQWVKISQGPAAVITGSQGSRIELECEAIGKPAPSIYWLHDSDENTQVSFERAFETNSILENPSKGLAKVRAKRVIYSARLEHAGQYTCVAKAGVHVATAQTNVIVTEVTAGGPRFTQLSAARAKPTIILHNSIYMNDIGTSIPRYKVDCTRETKISTNIQSGSDLVLPCRAIVPPNAPQMTVTWFNPEERIVPSETDNQQIGGKPPHRLVTLKNGSLQIRGVRWNDMGPYTCVVSNDNGHDSIITFLYPMLPEK